MIEVYKVVRRVRMQKLSVLMTIGKPDIVEFSQLRSAIVTGRYEIAYIPGEWAVPAIGYILAFDIPIHAQAFMLALRDQNELELWKGTAELDETHQRTYELLDTAFVQSEEMMSEFWRSPYANHRIKRSNLISAPHGSVICKRLNLTEQIHVADRRYFK